MAILPCIVSVVVQMTSEDRAIFQPFFYNFALIYSLLADSYKVPKYKYIINFSVADTLYMYFLMLKEITNKIGLVHS